MFGGLIPKFSQKLAECIGSANGAKKNANQKRDFFFPFSCFPTRKTWTSKKTWKMFAQPWSANNYDTQIGVHFGITHVSLSDVSFPTIPTAAPEKSRSEDRICQTQLIYVWHGGSMHYRFSTPLRIRDSGGAWPYWLTDTLVLYPLVFCACQYSMNPFLGCTFLVIEVITLQSRQLFHC